MQPGQLNVYSFRNQNTDTIQNVKLFEAEEMRAYLVVMPPGSTIDTHVHANTNELFDVVEGEGQFTVTAAPSAATAANASSSPPGFRTPSTTTATRSGHSASPTRNASPAPYRQDRQAHDPQETFLNLDSHDLKDYSDLEPRYTT